MRRLEHALPLLASIAVLLLQPVPGWSEESPPAKPRPTRAPASRPREEKALPPVLIPAPAAPAPTPVPAPPAPTPAPEAGKRAPGAAIEGAYSVEGAAAQVTVKRIFGDLYTVSSTDPWEGVGILDGAIYRGVFRHRDRPDAPEGAMGEQTIDWSDPENPSMQATYTVRRAGQFAQRWRRLTDSRKESGAKPPPPREPAGASGRRPEFGEYVYVDELPEAVTKVVPTYPTDRKLEGTVVVQALVLEDGSVGDVRVVSSVPMLDEAAIAAVRQWRFKPARAGGTPVAVWVAVPVRFASH